MKTKKNAFTMLEILVVVVIMSVLALLLFPVFGRVQERGREVKCASNLRQLHTATMSYISNSGGYLPYSASAKVYTRNAVGGLWNESGWENGWVASYPMGTASMKSYWYGSNGVYCVMNGTIFSYLGDQGDESVYVCPSMLKVARNAYPASNPRSKVTRSFGMNNALNHAEYSRIDGVSRKILFADQGFNKMAGKTHHLTLAETATTSDSAPVTSMIDFTVFHQRFYRSMDGSIDYGRERYSSSGPVIAQKADTQEYIGELHGNRPGQNTGIANAIFCDGHVERVVYTNTDSVCTGAWEYGRPVQ